MTRRANPLDRKDYHEPALRIEIVVADRIGDEGTVITGRTIDRRWVTVECVEVDNSGQWIARRVEHPQHHVDGLENKAVADAMANARATGRAGAETIR